VRAIFPREHRGMLGLTRTTHGDWADEFRLFLVHYSYRGQHEEWISSNGGLDTIVSDK
jgi:hypothetical protein